MVFEEDQNTDYRMDMSIRTQTDCIAEVNPNEYSHLMMMDQTTTLVDGVPMNLDNPAN